MHRTDADGHDSNLFTDGNPGLGVEATVVDASWLNDVQEEACYVIETKAGITLVEGTRTQLAAALDQLTLLPGGRLTLATGVPVTTTDQAGKTTVYYTPHRHDRVSVYDGTRWVWRTFTELSQATTDNTKSPAAVAADKVMDVFVWLDGSTLRATRGPPWSSDTSRGTGAGTSELEYFEGRWVNAIAITNGPAARRGLYVGTIRSDGSAQINDTLAKRHVWNQFHRTPRPMSVVEATDTWNYTTATLRQANGAAGNQLDYVVGLSEDPVSASVSARARNTNDAVLLAVGIGVDSTSTNSASLTASNAARVNANVPVSAQYSGFPGIGRHTIVWLEYSAATGTTTWVGDDGTPTVSQSGIVGQVLG